MPQPTELKVLFYDLETAPLLAHIWSPWDNFVTMDRLIHDSFVLTWSAKWWGQKKVLKGVLTPYEAIDQDDTRIVEELADLIREADIIVAHNGDKFDLPKFNARLLRHNLEPLGPTQTIDTLKLSKKNLGIAFNKLDYLGEYLGLGRKIKTDFQLWLDCYHGDAAALSTMSKYNVQDVRLLEAIFNRLLPYVKGLTRLMEPGSNGDTACPFCGKYNFVRRGYYRTQASTFVKLHCTHCKKYSRERTAIPQKFGVHPL